MRILCCKLTSSKVLELTILWLLKKALPSGEEPDSSLSIMNSKAPRALPINLKHGSAFNTRSNDFICTYIECVTSRKQKNRFASHCEW